MEWVCRKGKIEDHNRDFDYSFWQAASPQARLEAAWSMVVDYHLNIPGESEDKLRLQRCIVSVQRTSKSSDGT